MIIGSGFSNVTDYSAGILAGTLESARIQVLDDEFDLSGNGTWGISIGYCLGEEPTNVSQITGIRTSGAGELGIPLRTGGFARILWQNPFIRGPGSLGLPLPCVVRHSGTPP